MNDKLDQLFQKQEILMNRYKGLGFLPQFPLNLTEKTSVQVVRDCAFHLVQELFEVIAHLKNRPNRKTEIKDFDENDFKEEVADVLHLLIELLILCGIDSHELFDLYIKKNEINHKRINLGY